MTPHIRSFLFCIIILVFVSCQQRPTTSLQLTFNETKVGPVTIGQSREKVLKALVKRTWHEAEWVSEGESVGTRIEVYDGGFNVFIYKGVVDELRITNPDIRSPGGVGLGSTLDEVKKEFGKVPEIVYGEDGFAAVYEYKTTLIRFGLSVNHVSEKTLPDDTKVSFISVISK